MDLEEEKQLIENAKSDPLAFGEGHPTFSENRTGATLHIGRVALRCVLQSLCSMQSQYGPPSCVAASRSRSTSRIGGTPNSFLYSRLKCEASL